MDKTPEIWEDDHYYGIPEELFHLFPDNIRTVLSETISQGKSKLLEVDKEIDSLIKLIKVMPTVSTLNYTHRRLRKINFETTTDSFFELEMLTTAFVVIYSRVFVTSNGSFTLTRKDIPGHLRSVHDELMDIRNERYAHNGRHESRDEFTTFALDGKNVYIRSEMSLGFHIGGRNEWEELVACINKLIWDRLNKILERLEKRTGYKWLFPNGPDEE
ncbi:hypothetical protein [Cronobacter turicensis]|uniref:hypothetical protein n=1 Tax=Cronobacter turicensis TaxID=413502 RepID=UPI00357129E4